MIKELTSLRDGIADLLEDFQRRHPAYAVSIVQEYGRVEDDRAYIGQIAVQAVGENETVGTSYRSLEMPQ
jgi:hypothetical protein